MRPSPAMPSLAALIVVLLTACGGGGGSTAGGAPPTSIPNPTPTPVPTGPASATSTIMAFPATLPFSVGAASGTLSIPNGSFTPQSQLNVYGATAATSIGVQFSAAAPSGVPIAQVVRRRDTRRHMSLAPSPTQVLFYVTLSVPGVNTGYGGVVLAALGDVPGLTITPASTGVLNAAIYNNPANSAGTGWEQLGPSVSTTAGTAVTLPPAQSSINLYMLNTYNTVTLAYYLSNTLPTPAQATTNASGTVVNDANGVPLAGVPVKLMPWITCAATPAPAMSITPESDGCATPLPQPQATTNAQGQFTLANAPNGHYILIVGEDTVSTPPPGYAPATPNPAPTPCGTVGIPGCATPTPAPFTVAATVHDNVTLNGGNQTLVAPTLPSFTKGYAAPAWETNGDYRIATLDAEAEMPCYIAWNYERAQFSLAGSAPDEWLIENIRANNKYFIANGGGTGKALTSGLATVAGAGDCSEPNVTGLINAILFNGQNIYAVDPRTIWYGGQYVTFSALGGTNNEGYGLSSFPIDPRSFTDPNYPTWP